MEYSTSAPNERVWRVTQLAKLSFKHPSVGLTADVLNFFCKISAELPRQCYEQQQKQRKICALFHTYRNFSIKDIDTFRLDLCATVTDCQMYAMNTLIAILCLPRSTIPLSSRVNNLALIVSVSMRQTCSTGNLPVHFLRGTAPFQHFSGK